MNGLFLKVVNMSISAGWLILAVLILRPVLRKAPRRVNVLLWGIVAVRLICPVFIESPLSLIPSTETIPADIEMDASPAIDSGIDAVNRVINPVISDSFTPNPTASANPLQIWIALASVLWAAGMAALLLYTVVSCLILRRRVDTAVLHGNNIFLSENVSAPFVFGIARPKIYLPFKLDLQNMEYVIAHEQAHIRRKDHWWKQIGFLLLTVYWFHPLIWLAYGLFCRDIELACDERVIRELGCEQRADYVQALVACSVNRRRTAACPLAFGEVGVKTRVKAVMRYRKPDGRMIGLAAAACGAVAVCFLTDPGQVRTAGGQRTSLEQYRSDYLGDASNTAAVAESLPYPAGYGYSHIELQTAEQPYGLDIYLDGSRDVDGAAFQECGDLAFDLIGNLGVVSFWREGDLQPMVSFERDGTAAFQDE